MIFNFFLNCCIKHRKAVCHLSSSQTTEGIFSHCVLGWNYSLSSVAYEINRKLQLDVNIKYFWTSTVGIKALKAKLTSFYRADNNLLDYTSRLYQESVYEPSTELRRGKKRKRQPFAWSSFHRKALYLVSWIDSEVHPVVDYLVGKSKNIIQINNKCHSAARLKIYIYRYISISLSTYHRINMKFSKRSDDSRACLNLL